MQMRGVFIAAGLLWITSALVEDPITASISGSVLFDRCNGPENTQRQLYCLAYVAGTSDALNLVRAVCTPENVRTSQTMDIIVNYLRVHPERRDRPAPLLAGLA